MSNCPNCDKPFTPGDEMCQYCGYVFPFATDIVTTDTILQERYKIEELSHSGGMGHVYPARDIKLHNRLCIVKQVKEPVKSDDDLRKLEEEAIEMAKLNHPNVAMIFDHFVEGRFYFLVVEHIAGKTLGEIFSERQGKLTEDEVINWAISMCDVVSYLHKAGIVHRDISPQNIMLTDDGIIKFIDFGTLRELRHIATGGTAGMGKFGYTPPEQWLGTPEPRSDIFALGATIFYLLTGFLPLSKEYLDGQGPQRSDFNPIYPPIREMNPKISQELEAVLQKALQLDINRRYSSAAELGQALRSLIEVKAPVLSIDLERLDFSQIIAGKQRTQKFALMNVGTDRLTGKLTTSKPWLKVSPDILDLQPGEGEIHAIVDTSGLAAGVSDIGSINIVTNGGQASIEVALSTTSFTQRAFTIGLTWSWRFKWLLLLVILIAVAALIIPRTLLKAPALNVDSTEINFENVSPGDISNTRSVTITNTGGSILTGTVKSNKEWLIVSPTEINLPIGEEKITAQLDTRSIPYGFKDTGLIDITTNGGDVQITVNVTTTTIIHEDDFSNPASGWTASSSATGEAKYENGGYHLITKGAGHIIAGTNPAIKQLTDFILEVDAKSFSSAQDASYGIIFRQQDVRNFDNFYYFQIYSNTGQYKFEKQIQGVWSSLKELTTSNTINQASSTNRLKIVCVGDKIELYVNDINLSTINDSSLPSGFIGLAVASGAEQESSADVVFDNIKIYFPD